MAHVNYDHPRQRIPSLAVLSLRVLVTRLGCPSASPCFSSAVRPCPLSVESQPGTPSQLRIAAADAGDGMAGAGCPADRRRAGAYIDRDTMHVLSIRSLHTGQPPCCTTVRRHYDKPQTIYRTLIGDLCSTGYTRGSLPSQSSRVAILVVRSGALARLAFQ